MPDCGRDASNKEAYFFKLSNYTDRLVKHIENPEFIQPESEERNDEQLHQGRTSGFVCIKNSFQGREFL